ncbi:hypothetical protein HJC23_009821 [Cyclotella cryptica]|uniref:Uncharacterized protein n=1 Tax=Cyclotella cryptica TaxID=29204 RepID=A0ABD3PN58_9STRA|eukprot:CCRYP_014235-RA/>CCRYP_014235-RA protein AED:0.04 eAED:0.04 QI:0/-1/0/1/-1/1/1/0/927
MNPCLPHLADDDTTLCSDDASAFLSIIQNLPSRDYPSEPDLVFRRYNSYLLDRLSPSPSYDTAAPFPSCRGALCDVRRDSIDYTLYDDEDHSMMHRGCDETATLPMRGEDDQSISRRGRSALSPSMSEVSNDKSMVMTQGKNELTRCESLSLCSVLTERRDSFELGRDAGSPSRHAALFHAMGFHEEKGQETSVQDHSAIVAVPKVPVPLLCDSPKKKGGVVAKVLSTVTNGPKKTRKGAEGDVAGRTSKTDLVEKSVGIIVQGDVPRNHSVSQVLNKEENGPTDTQEAVDNVAGTDASNADGIGLQYKKDSSKHGEISHDIRKSPSKIGSGKRDDSPPPDQKDESMTSPKPKDIEGIKFPNTPLDDLRTSKELQDTITPTSSFSTANETESSSVGSPVHVPKKTKGGMKTIVTSRFLKKLKSKRSSRGVVTMDPALEATETEVVSVENSMSRSGQDNDDGIPRDTGSRNDSPSMDRSKDLIPQDGLTLQDNENKALQEASQGKVPRYDEISHRTPSCKAVTTPAPSPFDQWQDYDAVVISTADAASDERNLTSASIIIDEEEMPCNLSPIVRKASLERAAMNESIELDATGSITFMTTPPEYDDDGMLNVSRDSARESMSEKCRSFLSDVSRTLFPEELDGYPLAEAWKNGDVSIDPHGDFHLEGLPIEENDVSMTIECTLQNDDSGLFDVTIEEMEVDKIVARKEEGFNGGGTQEVEEGGPSERGVFVVSSNEQGQLRMSSKSTVASQDRLKMEASTCNNLFQMDVSSPDDSFGCTRASSVRTRNVEVEDVAPSSNEGDAAPSREMMENPLTSEAGNNVDNSFPENKDDPACNLSCNRREPLNEINETDRKPQGMDQKNLMIQPPSKIGWARTLRNRSQSIRMRSFRHGGNHGNRLAQSQEDEPSSQNERMTLQVLGEKVEVTLP